MKITILTSDILDGLVISQRIIDAGKDVKAILYETKKKTWKALLKRFLYLLKGEIRHLGYRGMAKARPGLRVEEVSDMNSGRAKKVLEEVKPDLIVVAGTGKLKKEIYSSAAKGAINMHSGILPYYRGADSEFWALYNGEADRIGVTIHFIDERLDAGDMILQERLRVGSRDDFKKLRMKNISLGSRKMVEAIELIEKEGHKRMPQDESVARTYRTHTARDQAVYLERTRTCAKK